MSEGLQERVPRNVRILMAIRGIEDQKTLAAHLKWGADRVSTSFSGRRRWALNDLEELAAVFRVTPADMLADATSLVNVAGPAMTGTDAVTRGVTGRYPTSNGARIISFPQAARLRAGYRIRKGRSRRVNPVTRAGSRGDHLIAQPVA
jgi:hypothetical protein